MSFLHTLVFLPLPATRPAEIVQMAEMSAIRMFMKMGAFDKIPLEGTISYRDLAASLGAEEALISTLSDAIFKYTSLTDPRSYGMDDGGYR